MDLIKNILAIMLISMIAVSCKSDKKETHMNHDEMIESSDDTSEPTHMDHKMESSNNESIEAETKESEEADSKEVEVVESDKISVVYPKDSELANEVDKAIKSMIADNPSLKEYFKKAHGFVVFPVITKAGLGIGGAGGKGLAFHDRTVTGKAKIAQATFGLQAGGQQYAEVVFFEDKVAFDKFKSGKLKFSGQASAVALKKGASTDVDYQDGVVIFTKVKGGIMAEASVGGQKFTYIDGI